MSTHGSRRPHRRRSSNQFRSDYPLSEDEVFLKEQIPPRIRPTQMKVIVWAVIILAAALISLALYAFAEMGSGIPEYDNKDLDQVLPSH